jgi:fructose-1,6-bisphosphatase/inositol monophosphatase family enzyme
MKAGHKEDGSPFTQLEHEIEEYCRNELEKFYPKAIFLGEESAASSSQILDEQITFVIDPIDGTRAFLSGFDSFSLTIAILKGRIPYFSLVASPSTGDIAFRVGTETSHIASSSFAGNTHEIRKLPLIEQEVDDTVLVNVHPSLSAKDYLDKLYELWNTGFVSLVKTVSGSPSWQIVEASKGTSIYINAWKGGRTMPFDLVAAFHILEGAGGVAYNFNGGLTDPWTNKGPFAAGCSQEKVQALVKNM